MHWILWKPRLSVLLTAVLWLWTTPGSLAQATSTVRSLGGYGATASEPDGQHGLEQPHDPLRR